MLEPRYVIPHRNFTRNVQQFKRFRPLVSSAKHFALTTNCWTSRGGQAFIGVTIHFITEDFQLKSFALTNEELPVSHNAANLATALQGILDE